MHAYVNTYIPTYKYANIKHTYIIHTYMHSMITVYSFICTYVGQYSKDGGRYKGAVRGRIFEG